MWRWRARAAFLRKAKLDPRRTIPSAASVRGMYSVVMIDANARPKAVQHTTMQKTSQTWLASHTVPIAESMSARGRSPRRRPPPMKSQKPAPKSAMPVQA
jgi:hypothetical protein